MAASQRLVNDQLVPLLGGAYSARSVIANAQRCVNLYPESNQADSEVPITHYPTPGLTLLVEALVAGLGRGVYWTTTGVLYAVVGGNVYSYSPTFVPTLVGAIPALSTPVVMIDNASTMFIVDGSAIGYEVDLPTNVLTAIADPNFEGATRMEFLDTYLVSNIPATQEFQSTHSGSPPVWDPLYVASKTAFSDNLITLAVVNREILLLGKLTSELWYNAGNPAFPFAIMQGVFIEHGIVAPYSVTKFSLSVFWLSQDREGQIVVLEFLNYQTKRISTFAIENIFSGFSTVSDCVAYTYQQGGHVFVVFNFPTANQTWVFDKEVGLWHQRVYTDNNGQENRHRVMAGCNAGNGVIVGLDWQNGNLYKFDLGNQTDNGQAIVRRRGFPHLVSNGRRIYYASFIADMECGTAGAPGPSTVFLRMSDDRGKTFGNPIALNLGGIGQRTVQPIARRLGQARDRVFELFWSDPAPTALNGAYIDPLPMAS